MRYAKITIKDMLWATFWAAVAAWSWTHADPGGYGMLFFTTVGATMFSSPVFAIGLLLGRKHLGAIIGGLICILWVGYWLFQEIIFALGV